MIHRTFLYAEFGFDSGKPELLYVGIIIPKSLEDVKTLFLIHRTSPLNSITKARHFIIVTKKHQFLVYDFSQFLRQCKIWRISMQFDH